MNTKRKGNEFEDVVFQAIKAELATEKLCFSPSYAKIYQKHSYHSPDRNADIEVDISIELWPPDAATYSLLWVCECKSYSRKIPVDDIEEFKAKLDQIAGKNVKGVLATRTNLQNAALTYAKSNGIGIVRMLTDNQVKWVIPYAPYNFDRRLPSLAEIETAITEQQYVGINRSFYSIYGSRQFNNWHGLLAHILNTQEDYE